MADAVTEIQTGRRQSATLERTKKLKILVVDDEPDNLDLLYRTFRRDFNVLKADSGVNALEVLAAEGEVAVIISDQRMPEMKGTEFLSKTVPQFPDTVRIILTGFTDIEDLVEAINAGQVYKYITKPWDPGELKAVVQRAAETYDLLKQRTEELRRANAQMSLLTVLVQVTQASNSLETILTPIATAFAESFAVNACILQMLEGQTLSTIQGFYSQQGTVNNWLNQDPLTNEAIATGQIQVAANIAKDPKLASISQYQDNGIQAHVVIPITYRNEMLGVLSLQWQQPISLREDELTLIHLSAQLVAIALTSSRCSL
ncbi:Response regulator receiver (CheY) and GAF domain protein [Trichormus variabilis ATCC 29413]|uniref:Response regulator receiver (CheY) and GAF domain protein n=2 Tax=Anabaena variabilis TaxID=264691 RepID=Q3MD90_TRIV2|nr:MULTISPECIES: response regulator [Nostocaceae]ABA21046.1 Response regulator receiver (CheY) and GAF domain protein [Trichormus variabilis ATCC 29413]MBC1216207.1 response regulator [Trichormus variabilis ARAD]MBC1255802.1 response regulator [Trichormus variabilis V5]MBC1268637.1 response regulator [Trichormus variabilis FSR]MBC1304670.1 response regulator [Trichormus variabilis N2B]